MDRETRSKLSNEIVEKILKNLTGRRGVGHELCMITDEVMAEMVADLTSLTYDTIREYENA